MKALITGATSGIGMSMARKLSKRGWELILTGRNERVLRDLQYELGRTEIITAELSKKEDVFKVYEFCRDKNVDLLVNNAGYGIFGRFEQTDLDDELNMINVNITAVHILTKLFLRDFKKRDHGMILNVASSAGFMTGPLLSSYYASKNYVVRLSLAIAEELRRDKSNVSITVLCPGPVDTNFNNRAGVTFSIKPLSPDYVAEYAIRKTFSRQLIAIPGLSVRAGVIASRFVPTKLMSAITYGIQHRKKTADGKGSAVTS
ncbi:MAG: SDR family oxidoreductase [Ruminococcus sp.]|jgi:short-subunit dehydrogenase|nr:SDR family oxidoreductase [Ruminococcus sp.]